MNSQKFGETDNVLTSYLNSLIPEFVSSTHDYFKESFLDNFKWTEKSDKLKFLVAYGVWKAYISHEGYLILGADNYFRGNYNISNFNKGRITGFGIINWFHEITHCYLQHKNIFQNRNLLSLPRLENSLMESFCDISAHRMADQYFEASEAIALEKKIYSSLVNRAKYGKYYFEKSTDGFIDDNFCFSEEQDELEIATDEAELFNNTSKAIAYSKLEPYASPEEMLSLFDTFKTFNELRYFIPKINY